MNKNTKQLYIFICLALLLSLGIRLFLFHHFLEQQSIETWEYSKLAENLANGKGFIIMHLETLYKSFTSPIYPGLIALLYRTFGVGFQKIVYFQIILSLSTCIFIFLIADRLASKKVAIIAFLLCLFHPALVIYSVKKIHALNLDMLLFALSFFSIIKLADKPSFGRVAICGLVLGISALDRFSILAFFPIALVWLFFAMNKSKFTKIVYIALFGICATFLVSVWTVRNYAVHDEFVMTATVDAELFWRGNNPHATGTSHTEAGDVVLMEDKSFYRKLILMNELQQRQAFREAGINFVKKNPSKFLKLFLKKFYYFWWFSPQAGLLYPFSYLVIYKFFYTIFLIFAGISIYNIFSHKITADSKGFVLLLFFLLSISLLQSIFYVEGRHRWAVEPLLLIFTAKGLILGTNTIKNIFNLKRMVQK